MSGLESDIAPGGKKVVLIFLSGSIFAYMIDKRENENSLVSCLHNGHGK